MLCTLHVPEDVKIYKPKGTTLPKDWNDFPIQQGTQLYGDRLLSNGKAAVIQLPSAVVSGDYNFLLNPWHPEFEKITLKQVEPFKFDRRFFRNL